MLYIHNRPWQIGDKFPSLDLSKDSIVRFTADGDELTILLQAIKDASEKEPLILSFDDKQKIKTIKIVRLFTGWG